MFSGYFKHLTVLPSCSCVLFYVSCSCESTLTCILSFTYHTSSLHLWSMFVYEHSEVFFLSLFSFVKTANVHLIDKSAFFCHPPSYVSMPPFFTSFIAGAKLFSWASLVSSFALFLRASQVFKPAVVIRVGDRCLTSN